jgi:hypothetical protein
MGLVFLPEIAVTADVGGRRAIVEGAAFDGATTPEAQSARRDARVTHSAGPDLNIGNHD